MNSAPNKTDYISLAEAAEHSPYTQEYLSLRARQGKLRAIKRGRNWVTTLGWLDDYLEQVDEAKTQLKEAPILTDKEFTFHPAATVQLKATEETEEPVGHLLREEESVVAPMKTFSWDEDESAPAVTYAQQRVFEQLRQRVDARLAAEEKPVIELDESEETGFWPAATYLAPAKKPSAAVHHAHHSTQQSEETGESLWSSLGGALKPMAAMAAFILVISTVWIFDSSLKIRENIALGTATVLTDIGSDLIAIGLAQEAKKQERQGVRTASATANATKTGSVEADGTVYHYEFDSADTSSTEPRVAGVTTENTQLGFWETVGLGAQKVLSDIIALF